MKLAPIAEVWQMMRESVIVTDRETVAENLIAILIDNDYSAADIRQAFHDDSEVMAALKYHIDDALAYDDGETSEDYADDEFLDDEDEWE